MTGHTPRPRPRTPAAATSTSLVLVDHRTSLSNAIAKSPNSLSQRAEPHNVVDGLQPPCWSSAFVAHRPNGLASQADAFSRRTSLHRSSATLHVPSNGIHVPVHVPFHVQRGTRVETFLFNLAPPRGWRRVTLWLSRKPPLTNFLQSSFDLRAALRQPRPRQHRHPVCHCRSDDHRWHHDPSLAHLGTSGRSPSPPAIAPSSRRHSSASSASFTSFCSCRIRSVATTSWPSPPSSLDDEGSTLKGPQVVTSALKRPSSRFSPPPPLPPPTVCVSHL